MSEGKKFSGFEYKKVFMLHMNDHNVDLSFHTDDGAVAFREWLEEEGLEAFNNWLGMEKRFRHLQEK